MPTRAPQVSLWCEFRMALFWWLFRALLVVLPRDHPQAYPVLKAIVTMGNGMRLP